jgi:hypothetical protein
VPVEFLDVHAPALDARGPRIGDPADVTLAELVLDDALRVADAIESQVADVRLSGHEGERHAAAQLLPAQRGVEDHRVFIGRAEAAGAGQRTDNDRAGIGAQPLEVLVAPFGMIDGAD